MNRKQRRAQSRSGNPGAELRAASTSIAKWFGAATAFHGAGRTIEAEQVCRQILSREPDHAPTLHLLGLIEHRHGRANDAIDHIRAAISRHGRDPAFHHNLGNILRETNRRAEALTCYQRALALAPDSVDTLYNLANTCHELGQIEQAVGYFERAMRHRPDAIELYNNLGAALQDLGRLDDAIACYRKALALWPDALDVIDNLAGALREKGQLEEAQACCEHALKLAPDRLESHITFGAVLRDRGRLQDALHYYERAAALAPDHPVAHNNIGVALVELDRLAEAIEHYRVALAVQPDRAETHNNLGIAFERQGRYAEALDCYGRALELSPDYAEAHFNRAHALLATGDFTEGWQEYEWRFAVARYDRKFDRPLWSGDALAGRTLLIHAEQGFGDTLQFVRYLPLVAQRGGRVVLEVPKPLVRLADTVSGASQIIPAGESLPRFDCHCPLLSLPRVLNATIATIPNTVPYLAADPDRVRFWRDRLPQARRVVGIAWQGNPQARMDRMRSIPLAEFAPLAVLPGISLVSLQKHDGLDQLASLPSGMRVETLGADFDAGPDAFLDTAAVMMSLDLVIACDSSVAHLAGALARPIWLMLSHYPDWRWLTGRADSPWYPTARLFRQQQPGDWAGVVRGAAAALANFGS